MRIKCHYAIPKDYKFILIPHILKMDINKEFRE